MSVEVGKEFNGIAAVRAYDKGETHIGTCFHIGNGIVVTAASVVAARELLYIEPWDSNFGVQADIVRMEASPNLAILKIDAHHWDTSLYISTQPIKLPKDFDCLFFSSPDEPRRMGGRITERKERLFEGVLEATAVSGVGLLGAPAVERGTTSVLGVLVEGLDARAYLVPAEEIPSVEKVEAFLASSGKGKSSATRRPRASANRSASESAPRSGPAKATTDVEPSSASPMPALEGAEKPGGGIGTGLNICREASDSALKLNFPKYALAIARVLRDANGEFCMALLGRWGAGKTRLARLVVRYMTDPESFSGELKGEGLPEAETDKLRYSVVWFSAWQYRRVPEAWIYLYETFAKALVAPAAPRGGGGKHTRNLTTRPSSCGLHV
jgi:hypothetical protein